MKARSKLKMGLGEQRKKGSLVYHLKTLLLGPTFRKSAVGGTADMVRLVRKMTVWRRMRMVRALMPS